MTPTPERRAELIRELREAFSQPAGPDDGNDLPDAPPTPKAGQQTVAVMITKSPEVTPVAATSAKPDDRG